MAQALKSPPFAKGGLEGFPPRLIPKKGRIQSDDLAVDYPHPRVFRLDTALRDAGPGEIPPTPLLRKGGFLMACANARLPPSASLPPFAPLRQSPRPSRYAGPYRGSGFRPAPE